VTNKSLYVQANYEVNRTPQFKVLSNDQCEEAYLGALEILERTGVEIDSAEALRLFQDNGGWVDGNRVRFPSAVIERLVKNVPCRLVISNRTGKRTLFLEAQNIYLGPGSGQSFVLDPLTGERRAFQNSDDEKTALVCDALSNIDFAAGQGVYAFADLVKNTVKPIIVQVSTVEQCTDIMDIAVAVAGSKEAVERNPFFMLRVESTAPLKGAGGAIDAAIFAGKNQIPVIYSTQAFSGDTAPGTMAGSLVLVLADCLVGLAAHQLTKPGAPIVMGGLISALDKGTNTRSYGSPEHGLLSSAFVDVCRYLHIPSFVMGGCTDAKAIDAQGSVEAVFSLLSGGLSGANLIQGCNIVESGNTASLDLLVMNNEIIGMVKRVLKGIPATDETMAVDVIDEVGPGGHFLGAEHTLTNFRGETWWPSLLNRNRYDDWVAGGKKTLSKRVNEKTQNILHTHQPEPLPEDRLAGINKILAALKSRA